MFHSSLKTEDWLADEAQRQSAENSLLLRGGQCLKPYHYQENCLTQNPLIKMFVSPKNTLTETPRIMFNQIFECCVV